MSLTTTGVVLIEVVTFVRPNLITLLPISVADVSFGDMSLEA